MIKGFHRIVIILLFFLSTCFANSCQKTYSNESMATLHTLTDNVGINTKGAEIDYSVSKEMIESFIKSYPVKKTILSIEGYPSEELPSLYVVNFDEGWAIYPSDSRFGMVIAENPLGHINLKEKSNNLGFFLWIESAQEQIDHFRGLPMDDFDEPAVSVWNMFRQKETRKDYDSQKNKNLNQLREEGWVLVDLGDSFLDSLIAEVGHIVHTRWGQGSPWNKQMPIINSDTCKVGCAAVAVSQVLYSFNFREAIPSDLYHTISESSRSYDNGYIILNLSRSDYTTNSPRWGQMSLSTSYGNNLGFEYVSDLMLDIGVRLNMHYGTAQSYILPGQNNFYDLSPVNLSYSWDEYTYSMRDTVKMNIIARKPVIITATSSYYNVSHTWVIDLVYDHCYNYYHNYQLWTDSDMPDNVTILEYYTEDELEDLFPDYYSGMIIQDRYQQYDMMQFGMNFGDDGLYSSVLLSASPYASWEGFDINKSIHYNLTPGDLLIQ